MEKNKQYFLDFLSGTATVRAFFEPFMDRAMAETLIWRRGSHLWDTPAAYLDTLASCTDRTRSDMLFADLRVFSGSDKECLVAEISAFRQKDSRTGIGVICDCREDVALSENVADCLCLYGDTLSEKVPVIRMDGTPEEAIARGESGWFAPDHALTYLAACGDRIRILGGLGAAELCTLKPVAIYDTVAAIAARYPTQWACGSGGCIDHAHYLEFISMLGAYGRIR